jgi:hypothetical protein
MPLSSGGMKKSYGRDRKVAKVLDLLTLRRRLVRGKIVQEVCALADDLPWRER